MTAEKLRVTTTRHSIPKCSRGSPSAEANSATREIEGKQYVRKEESWIEIKIQIQRDKDVYIKKIQTDKDI